MKHIIITCLMLFLVSGCTINYKIEPEQIKDELAPLPERVPPHPPLVLEKPVNKNCLVTSLAPLDSVKAIKKEDYRADKNIIGYINDLERQHELLLKVKEQYERCKIQD